MSGRGLRFFRYANIAIPGFGATRRSVSLSFFAFQSGNNPRFRAIRRTGLRYDLLSMAVFLPIGSRTGAMLDMAPGMVTRWFHEIKCYICICMESGAAAAAS